ncbi:MAG: hypothetical protein JJT96_13415 [Opitutales bacterium]|nr:hypothetical protein [Opitutales bacterium]
MAKLPPYGSLMVASAWTGNAFLTLFAGYLAFSHAGPLTPGTILTVALCLLSGNSLPLAVHYLHFRWEHARLEAETVKADESLRAALRRLADTENRLEAAEGAIAKSLLLARQIPERLQEQAQALETKLRRLEGPELIALERTFDRLNESLVEIGGRVEENTAVGRDEGLNAAEREQRLLAAMALLSERLDAVMREGAVIEAPVDVAAAEETAVGTTDVPAEEVAVPAVDGADAAKPEADDEADDGADDGADDEADDPDWSVSFDDEAAADWEAAGEFADEADVLSSEGDQADVAAEEPDSPEANPERAVPSDREPSAKAEAAVEAPEASAGPESPSSEAPGPALPKNPRKPRKEKEADDPAFNLFPEFGKPKPPPPPADEAVLDVRAMIGIQNKLFLRGDPPFLSWDKGIPLPLTGIGEYRWTCRGLEQPVSCKLILNDTDWAAGENITLVPGEVVRVTPRF